MSTIDLTQRQRTVLTTLINIYRANENLIKTDVIAEEVNRKSGTIRNQMQDLSSLQLAEGIAGPGGGYMPTAKAYEALDIEHVNDPASVQLIHNEEVIETVNIEEITLSSVYNPQLCRAEIHVQGSIRDFQYGDEISVGPTPVSKLQITGTIDGKDETRSVLILKVDDMLAPSKNKPHIIEISD